MVIKKYIDNPYSPENITLFEILYGKNLISLGGEDAINNMFSDIDLTGLKALDVGFGLGGVAFYLANTYQIEISGVEVHNWMAKYAKEHAPRNIACLLKFAVYDQEENIPFKSSSFDLVYSKGVLNHVKDKHSLFRQIYKVLKANGLFVIADWIYPNAVSDDSSPLVCETRESYQQVLEVAGFRDSEIRDDSGIFIIYVEKLLKNISSNQVYIENKFGMEIFSKIWDDHQKLIDDINRKKKFAVRIKAIKR